ncbi:MAG: sugar phosphate isomerase/epimerase [Magnetospirillum sp.]|nr:sugar phosphate isomerase/epimerase [Magnetospirillum sp.]
MKLAVSNIALPPYDHHSALQQLPSLGLSGLEVAPSRVWHDTWKQLSNAQVDAYRHLVEGAGLKVLGLHSLFWDQPQLGLFKGPEARAQSVEFLVHLSGVCRDLGGHTLVYGSAPARRRGDLPLEAAMAEAKSFFAEVAEAIADHGTCICIEPLSTAEADFIHSVSEAMAIVEHVGLPSLRTHLDAKALIAAGEDNIEVFRTAAPSVAHFHANQPDLGVLRQDGEVPHARFGALLREIGYDRYVSIEQRMLNPDAPLADVAASAAVLRACYS